MKKQYLEPEVEVLELDMKENLLVTISGGDGSEWGGTKTDPTEPGWGSDY